MFCRAFRVRSNTAIKGSDRRKLRTDVAAAFPNLSAEQLTEFIPNKEELNVIKIYTHKGEAVTVYMNSRNPILFEAEKALYPTVYALWAYPDLLPAFSTWPPVLQKLAGGAGEVGFLALSATYGSRLKRKDSYFLEPALDAVQNHESQAFRT